MNSHKNARLTFEGRKRLIERIAAMGLIPAAEAAGISRQTARKWLLRFERGGESPLQDRTSRPQRTRTTIDLALAERIELLRRTRANAPDRRARRAQCGHHQPFPGGTGAVQPEIT